MKTILLTAIMFGFNLARAEQSQYTYIRGEAAAELYDKLDIQEVGVRDEHGNVTTALAKYGDRIGCQKDLDNTNFQCWFKK